MVVVEHEDGKTESTITTASAVPQQKQEEESLGSNGGEEEEQQVEEEEKVEEDADDASAAAHRESVPPVVEAAPRIDFIPGDDDMEAGAVVEASSPASSVADTAGDDGGATPAGKAEDGEGVDREDEEGESADGGGE